LCRKANVTRREASDGSTDVSFLGPKSHTRELTQRIIAIACLATNLQGVRMAHRRKTPGVNHPAFGFVSLLYHRAGEPAEMVWILTY